MQKIAFGVRPFSVASVGARARAEREPTLRRMQQDYLALYGRLLDLPVVAAAPA